MSRVQVEQDLEETFHRGLKKKRRSSAALVNLITHWLHRHTAATRKRRQFTHSHGLDALDAQMTDMYNHTADIISCTHNTYSHTTGVAWCLKGSSQRCQRTGLLNVFDSKAHRLIQQYSHTKTSSISAGKVFIPCKYWQIINKSFFCCCFKINFNAHFVSF